MLKKRIKFTDYNGVEREQDFYFNLSRAELTMLDLSKSGGVLQHMQTIIDTRNSVEIGASFEWIILASYGEKSPDGLRMMKSPEIAQAFKETEAYDQLFMQMMNDAVFAAEFFNNVIPKPPAPPPQPR